ncbi:MAG: metallophosphoesterase [Clostridia bacterium]|nr:metallophosphoesterase [Clostridia bacterium]
MKTYLKILTVLLAVIALTAMLLTVCFAADGDGDGFAFAQDDYFDMQKAVNLSGAVTFEAVMTLPGDSETSANCWILGNFKDWNTTSRSFGIGLNTSRRIRVFACKGGQSSNSDSVTFTLPTDMDADQYHSVIFTVDNKLTLQDDGKYGVNVFLYVDGEKIDGTDYLGSWAVDYDEETMTLDSNFLNQTTPLRVGGDLRSNNTSYLKNEKVKSVAMYNGLAAADETGAFTTDGLTPIFSYDLVGANSSSVLVDLSGNGNDAKGSKYTEPDYDYSFAIVGDTQYMTRWDTVKNNGTVSETDHLARVYDWIISNKTSKKINYVMGLGDITDSYDKTYDTVSSSGYAFDTAAEWKWAYEQISRLDGIVPYSVIRGNHDNETYFNKYFYKDEDATADTETVSPYFENNITGIRSEVDGVLNSYSIFEAGNEKYLLLLLDDNPTNDAIEWAAGVIEENPDCRVIINTHTYMGYTGEHIDHTQEKWAYAVNDLNKDKGDLADTDGAYENDGSELWEKLVSKHVNIIMVLCGHDHKATDIVRRVRKGDNGNAVTEMLICPQSLDSNSETETKAGMVAMLYFSNGGKDIKIEYVKTAASTDGTDVYHNATANNVSVYVTGGEFVDVGYATSVYSPYVNADNYSLAVFSENEHIGSYSDWKTAMGAAKNLITQLDADARRAEVVLLKDMTASTYDNTSQMGGTLLIDLNDHTLTGGGSVILNGAGKWNATDPVFDTTIRIINGNINFKSKPFTTYGIMTASYVGEKSFNYTFESVCFGFASGATTTYMLAASTNSDKDTDNTKTLTTNMVFNDCTFDLVTNAPSGARLFEFTEPADKGIINSHVEINGGKLIRSTQTENSLYTLGSNDSVAFGKYEGEYTMFEFPSGVMPEDERFVATSQSAGELVFDFVSDNGEKSIYVLIPKLVKEFTFVPKSSITLESNLVLNIYVPENQYLTGFTLDGKTYLKNDLIAENGQYLKSIKLPAAEAAKEIALTVTFELADETLTGEFTLSTLKYAEKLLAKSTSTTEKTLVCDMLAYIKSAYTYFAKTDEEIANATTVGDRIDAIIDGYTLTSFEKVGGTTTDMTGDPSAVTFILDSTPRVRFYFAQGTDLSKYTFKIGNTSVSYAVTYDTVSGISYACADISLFAYKMISTIDVYEGSEKLGSFHIDSYYDFVKEQNNASLTDLVEKFYTYCISAKSYRDEIISSQNN